MEDQETTEEVQVFTVTQEDFYNFNNNFCTLSIALLLCIGIVCGLIAGQAFRGIFKDNG